MSNTTRTPPSSASPAAPAPTPVGEPPAEEQLGQRKLGVWGIVFLIIAASAPLTVMAGGVPTSFAVTGSLGVPLGYVLLGAILAMFAVGYGTMSTQIQNAGAFYAYIAAGLGVRQGIGAAILALVAYNSMQVGLYGIIGFATSSLLEASFGLAVPWWASAIVLWLVVGLLGTLSIDLSAKVIAVLVVFEFLIVIVADVLGLSAAPEGISMAPLLPAELIGPSLGAVLAFGVAAFMGFESGAIYAEEARDPERTVRTATYLAVGIIAVFYTFSAWAFANGLGVSSMIGASQEHGPDLLFVFFADRMPGWFVNLANVLFITSLLAALMAFHNAAARYFFALARPGVLPRALARVSERTGAPVGGSIAQSALALVVIIGFTIAGQGSELGPLFPVITMFTWLTNAAAFGLVFLMAVTSVAVLAYFAKNRGEHSVFVRIVAPGIAALGLGGVFLMILVNFNVLMGSEGFDPLVIVMPAIILGAGLLGLLRGEWMRRYRPDDFRLAATDLDKIE